MDFIGFHFGLYFKKNLILDIKRHNLSVTYAVGANKEEGRVSDYDKGCIQGLEDDFNSTIIFKVLARSLDLLLQNEQTWMASLDLYTAVPKVTNHHGSTNWLK